MSRCRSRRHAAAVTRSSHTHSIDGLHVGGQPVSKKEDVFPSRPQWLELATISSTRRTATSNAARCSRRSPPPRFPSEPTSRCSAPPHTMARRLLDTTETQRVSGIVSPVVAPNGQSIAFIAIGDVWILPIGGVPFRVTEDSFVELDPAWAPDGSRRSAFASDREGACDLWIHDLKTNDDVQITKTGGVSGPAWSPDGAHIAYLVDGRAVQIVTLRRDGHNLPITSLASAVNSDARPGDRIRIALAASASSRTRIDPARASTRSCCTASIRTRCSRPCCSRTIRSAIASTTCRCGRRTDS